MVKLYVCKICGEPYLGGEAPDDCPFCGAPQRYLKDAEEFSELWNIELTEQEKKDMQETLDLEINAAGYYKKVAGVNKKYSKENRLFKQLARVELEHVEIVVKFLKIEMPEIVGEEPKGSFNEDLERTKALEADAIEKYEGFLKNAESPNIKNLYVALIHAEKGHGEIAENEISGNEK